MARLVWRRLAVMNRMRLLSLVPEPGPRRPYALSVLVTMFGFGLVMTA